MPNNEPSFKSVAGVFQRKESYIYVCMLSAGLTQVFVESALLETERKKAEMLQNHANMDSKLFTMSLLV